MNLQRWSLFSVLILGVTTQSSRAQLSLDQTKLKEPCEAAPDDRCANIEQDFGCTRVKCIFALMSNGKESDRDRAASLALQLHNNIGTCSTRLLHLVVQAIQQNTPIPRLSGQWTQWRDISKKTNENYPEGSKKPRIVWLSGSIISFYQDIIDGQISKDKQPFVTREMNEVEQNVRECLAVERNVRPNAGDFPQESPTSSSQPELKTLVPTYAQQEAPTAENTKARATLQSAPTIHGNPATASSPAPNSEIDRRSQLPANNRAAAAWQGLQVPSSAIFPGQRSPDINPSSANLNKHSLTVAQQVGIVVASVVTTAGTVTGIAFLWNHVQVTNSPF